MARIPEDKIEWIKKNVPIERLCIRYNIELKPQGKNLVGRCPWHQDDTPSFIVTPEKLPKRQRASLLRRLVEQPILEDSTLPGKKVPVTPSTRDLNVIDVIEIK
jgi:hypothetical protein